VLTLILAATLAATEPVPACTLPDGTRIQLELALTDQERAMGLMYRDHLAPDHGMFFLFDKDDRYPFWMKNTFIPLDIAWLAGDGRIVELRTNVQPCHGDPCTSYVPTAIARAVVEIPAGTAAPHGLRPGTPLRCEHIPGFPVAAQQGK